MLGTPVSGWSHITIGDFEGSASYLTDVANDCLKAMIHSLKTGFDFVVSFDAEGWTFKVIADEYTTYIIEEKDEAKLYTVEKNRIELAKEILFDIEDSFDLWIHWDYIEEFDTDGSELKKEEDRLKKNLETLKEMLKD